MIRGQGVEDEKTETVTFRCRGEIGARPARTLGAARRLVEFWRRRRSYEKLQTGVGRFCGEPGKGRRSEIMLIPYFIRSRKEGVVYLETIYSRNARSLIVSKG